MRISVISMLNIVLENKYGKEDEMNMRRTEEIINMRRTEYRKIDKP